MKTPPSRQSQKLRLDIWSDIACPWCYVGKRHLEAALAKFAHKGDVEIVWRAFELDPDAPRIRDTSISYPARLASKYGCSVDDAEGMIATMTKTAANDGLEFRFDRIQSGNTFDAHRLLHLAHEHGVQDAVKERFLLAYMTQGEPIGDKDALVRLAKEAGLDEGEARGVVDSDRYADDVRADERLARELGINGVPFFVVAGRYGVSGAQPAEALLRVLEQAWGQRDIALESVVADGETCGPDGCN